MQILVPDYYSRFSCLAGQCRHTCCKGWEVDIDPASCRKYLAFPGETGNMLRENIRLSGDGSASFRLTEDDRCPFLRKDLLCELICREGEEILCDICRDHPRYRSFFSDRTELGLGLGCEEAARLILTWPGTVGWTPLERDPEPAEPLTEEERELLDIRSELIRIFQNRSLPFSRRLRKAFEWSSLPEETDLRAFAGFLLTLERMDENWTGLLNRYLSSPPVPDPEPDALPDLYSEQLAVYLLSRHLPEALEDGELSGRVRFCLLIPLFLRSLWAAEAHGTGAPRPELFPEICRLYSCEIEYSDENIPLILDRLSTEEPPDIP